MRSTITTDYNRSGLAVFDFVQLKSALILGEPVIIVAESMSKFRCLELQDEVQGPDLTKERPSAR
jgi:hypothetical protein